MYQIKKHLRLFLEIAILYKKQNRLIFRNGFLISGFLLYVVGITEGQVVCVPHLQQLASIIQKYLKIFVYQWNIKHALERNKTIPSKSR